MKRNRQIAAARQPRRWARLGCGVLLAALPAFGNGPELGTMLYLDDVGPRTRLMVQQPTDEAAGGARFAHRLV